MGAILHASMTKVSAMFPARLHACSFARSVRVVDVSSTSDAAAASSPKRLHALGTTSSVSTNPRPCCAWRAPQRPDARFIRGSVFDVDIPPCVGVAAVGEVVCYRFDRRSGMAALRSLARRIFLSLEPGGVFLFDVSSPGRGGPDGTFVRWREGRDWSIVSRTTERRGGLTREMSVFLREDGSYRRVDETHELVLYPSSDVVAVLRRAGFGVRMLPGYGSLRLPGWNAFLARKPGRASSAGR